MAGVSFEIVFCEAVVSDQHVGVGVLKTLWLEKIDTIEEATRISN